MTKVFVVFETYTSYDQDENPCGDSFIIIGVYTDLERARRATLEDSDREMEECILNKGE